MNGPHQYKSLDDSQHDDRCIVVERTTRQIAEMIDAVNYGAHRVLSHLIDIRREKLAARVAEYRARGDHDVADSAEAYGNQLADGLEALLKAGAY